MSSNLSSSFLQFKVEMSKVSNHSIYRFDEFGLDAEKLMLLPRGTGSAAAPKVVKSLAVLVENGKFDGNSRSDHQFFDSSQTHPVWSRNINGELGIDRVRHLSLDSTP
jgi:hypothetical protein